MNRAIGINFLRPCAAGAHAFVHGHEEALDRVRSLGVSRIRLLFPQQHMTREGGYDFAPWDAIADRCRETGIEILAVLRGRGEPAAILDFFGAVQARFASAVACWELDCPDGVGPDAYLADILRPGYALLKAAQPGCIILPDRDSRLPRSFYRDARGAFDAAHDTCIPDWGFLRLETGCEEDIARVRALRARLDEAGCADVPLWITEAGWFGMSGLTGELADHYSIIPDYLGEDETIRDPIAGSYTGAALLDHPLTAREDALCARWMAECYPALLEAGVERIYHTRLADEFQDGYGDEAAYGRDAGRSASLWGLVDGRGLLRRSAAVLADLAGRE